MYLADVSSLLARKLGRTLKERRLSAGISQTTLAAELGVDQSFVSRVESGSRELSIEQWFLWMDTLGTPPQVAGGDLVRLWTQSVSNRQSYWQDDFGRNN